ncbi:MAG: acyl carrier protein [Gammaproteobacteria bacterium]
MNQTTTTNRIRDYISDTFGGALPKNFDENESLLEAGILDSMSVLEVVSFIETEFEISIDDDDLEAELFQSVRTLSDFVLRQVGQNGADLTN